MYSQGNEEEFILDALAGTKGRFLDIGAFDGVLYSNTRALAELGWTGVLVEPSPQPFLNLIELYAQIPDYTLIHAAVTPQRGLVKFYDAHGHPLSSSNETHRRDWLKAVGHWNEFYTATITPDDLLDLVGYNFQFVSIDVEGGNWELTCVFPWYKLVEFGLRLVCIEHQSRQLQFEELFRPFGFEVIRETPENILLHRP